MLKSTTLELPDSLVSRATKYAADHQMTLTALVIEQLEAVTNMPNGDALVKFSRGEVSKEQAIAAAGLRDYAQLLVALGDADLPLPALPEVDIERQAAVFAELFEDR